MQFTIVVVALLTSIGVAGIPSASLVAIVIILKAIGLPDTAIGLILVVDRPLDMLRTAVNVWSDSCGAAIIAATEGEKIIQNK
jgi:Na+/H+-dicarboxylate symporter